MVYDSGQSIAACKGGWGLGIAKNAQHPQEAWRAIQFFTSEVAQRKFVLESGYLPSRRSLFTEPQIVAEYSHFPEVLEMVEHAVLRPPIPEYDQASKILQRYLSAALTGQPSEETMKAAANETRKLLSE